MMRRLVALAAPPGATVLDPFSGAGTTLAAAVGSGGHAVGIELNPAYRRCASGLVSRIIA
jgi:DNA modification methylase